jgi:hypothetical protein
MKTFGRAVRVADGRPSNILWCVFYVQARLP